ncbi:lipocalin-like domain-containing protein [Vreelandella gomseomensis]|uniref:Lipocalin-like domain-containing protein n=1 Tax=Vreelandella gomseomensis TaxID=370766 RepID=A0ABU1GGM5_9GAMM|nr:lipocalin-like domain-containing protein [Halomonas gomseomensis]MDR5876605.1 lipocalin-like domain-containing protein [Halomonas gomseomensis]
MNYSRLSTALVAMACAILIGCQKSPSDAAPQGFAGLGANAEEFAQADASTPLSFPRDHGAHPDYRIEWWYLTANLEDDQGQPLGLQWTLFRQALTPPDERPDPAPWTADQVWMAHMGISRGATHVAAERFARSHSQHANGQAGVNAAPFEAWIDDWVLKSPEDASFEDFTLSAYSGEGADRFGYSLTLEPQGPLVQHGENGFNAKTVEGQGSRYYSQPFLQITGQVTLNGETREVSGQGWLDREWSSQLLTPEQTGWDWFSLHLNDGRKLMAYRLRGGGEDGGDYAFAHLISADGETELIGADRVTLTPLKTQPVAGRDMPTRWSLTLPDADLQLTVEARHPNRWMPTSVPYWEGDVVVRQSETQEKIGVGYLEMTGY